MAAPKTFSATLGTRERLITYLVGVGVFLGVPLILGIGFAVGFSEPLFLLFPLPFVLALGAIYLFRPTAYSVGPDEIAVIRPVGRKRFPMDSLREIVSPASDPPKSSFGIARVEGFFGTFGSYWDRSWGRFRVYVTNAQNTVELQFDDGSRLIISPDHVEGFVSAVQDSASSHVGYRPGQTESRR